MKQYGPKSRIAMTSLLALALGAATPALAEPITLKSKNGSLSLVGDLVGFQNGSYQIETRLGAFKVQASMVSCEGAGCPSIDEEPAYDFRIAGSDSVGADLMPLLIAGYVQSLGAAVQRTAGAEEKRFSFQALAEEGNGDQLFNAGIRIRGSSGGFKSLIAGEADVSMASRPVRKSEVEAGRAAGLGQLDDFAQEHSIGVDGMLVVVNHENPIDSLTETQVAQLLSGEIKNWAEVGGPDLPVKVYSRRLESSNHGSIDKRFLAPRGLTLSPDATVLPRNQVMADTVLAEAGAIGYLPFAYKQDTKPLGLISNCGITAIPDGFSTKAGEYPLQRTLFLYTGATGLPQHAKGLVEFATSSNADALVRKSGFLDYSVSTRPLDGSAETLRAAIDATNSPSEQNLLREMFFDMTQRERLSTTFRFRTGSSTLDNASQRDLRRLAAYLADLPSDAEIVFAGFTDSDGSFEANRGLSEQRAAEVEAALLRLAGDGALSGKRVLRKGYGELNPVGCNNDFQGQRLNRRVEIWVRSTG